VFLSSLQLQNFRNYRNLDISFEKGGALFYGDNGAGKTNIIEAIYFLSLGRSQRGAPKADMIHTGSNEAYIEGAYDNANDSSPTSISIGFSRDRKIVMKRDNQKVYKLSEFIVQSNVVAFGPQDIMLVYGDPSERRRFIDIVLSQVREEYLGNLIHYRKNLVNRNRLLNTKSNDTSINIYEEKMAEYGAEIVAERMKLFSFISPHFSDYYSSITRNGNAGAVHYKPSVKSDVCEKAQWREMFHLKLKERRERDMVLGFSSFGPHRDDFICFINERPAKFYGSQGECRIMAFSLRLCSLCYLEKERPGNKIILIDDAFAELDRDKGNNIFPLIRNRGQLFITTHAKDDVLFQELPCFTITNNAVVSI
jgi:DNA replication and repair protein RecF